MRKHLMIAVVVFGAMAACASDQPPGVITEFCAEKLNGDIAGKGQPFSATDVVREGIPARRILEYLVTSSTSFLWYEHGGRGYHQHLVRFSTVKPDNVEASYIFLKYNDRSIEQLIKDTEFLSTHAAKDDEL